MARIDTPFTNEHFVAWCEKMLGQPYWYGSCAYKATAALLNRKSRQYPSHYGSARTARYQQDIRNRAVVCDCIGGLKGYCWTGGGQSALEAIGTDKAVASRYGANGCPDKGANGMFRYAKSKGMAWGTIDTLPDVIGLALYRDGHVGYAVGGGYAVEWRGFAYGCVKTRIAERDWTHWYQIPFLDYGSAGFDSPGGNAFTQAALGGEIDVPTLGGTTKYNIPAGTQEGTSFRIRGEGIQQFRGTNRGDMFFTVHVEVPKHLGEKQKELLRQFEDSLNGREYERRKSFGDQVKSYIRDNAERFKEKFEKK